MGPDSLPVLRCPEQAECPCQRVMATRKAPAHSFCSSDGAHPLLWAASTQMPLLLLTHPISVCLAYCYPLGHCCPLACWFPPAPWCPPPCQCPAAHQHPLALTAHIILSGALSHGVPASAHLPHGAHCPAAPTFPSPTSLSDAHSQPSPLQCPPVTLPIFPTQSPDRCHLPAPPVSLIPSHGCPCPHCPPYPPGAHLPAGRRGRPRRGA